MYRLVKIKDISDKHSAVMKKASDAEELLTSIQHREEELDKHLRWSESTVMEVELSIFKVGRVYMGNFMHESIRKLRSCLGF